MIRSEDMVVSRDRTSEKRKVGSSTLPLTTSFGLVSSALTSANAVWVPWYLQRSSDHDCPCPTVVGRSLSHADRTSCHGAPVLRAAPSGTWRHDRLTSTTLPAGCTIKPPDAGSRQCPWVTALLKKQLSSSNPSGSWPKLTPTGQPAWRDTNRSSGACSNACARTGSNRSATRSPSLLIRRFLCEHPDLFRSVRDLGLVSLGCPGGSGSSRTVYRRSCAGPMLHICRHVSAVVQWLGSSIGSSRGPEPISEGPRAS